MKSPSSTIDRTSVLPVLIALGLAAMIANAVVQNDPVSLGLVLLTLVIAGLAVLLRHPSIIFWGILLTAPLKDVLGVRAGPITLRPYNSLVCVGFLFLTWMLLTHRPITAFRMVKKFSFLFLLLVLFCVSKVVTIYSLSNLPVGMTKIFVLKHVIFAIFVFSTAFITMCFADSFDRVKKAIIWWIHLANVILLIGIAQLILSNIFGMEYVWHRDIIAIGRAPSVFREPDVFGCFTGATVLVVLPLLVFKVGKLPRAYLIATLLGQSALLLLTFVRGAWLGAIAGGIFLILTMIRTGYEKRLKTFFNRAVVGIIAAILLLIIVAPGTASVFARRFASIGAPKGESASEYRMLELTTMRDSTLPGTPMSGDTMTFLFGHGDFGWSYWGPALIPEEQYDQTAKKLAKTGEVIVHPGFSMPLSTLFDNGLVGFALYAMFWVVLIFGYFATLRKTSDRVSQAFLMATFLPVICVFVCFQFSYDPIEPFLWVLIGLHLAVRYYVDQKDESLSGEIINQQEKDA